MTSERLAVTFTTCTTTPRSGRKYVEELARTYDVSVHEHLYEEAKLALVQFDIKTARTLFAQCPDDYRNTRAYREKCHRYEELCSEGVILRPELRDLRRAVEAVFCDASQTTACYAECLHAAGYTRDAIDTATLWDMADLLELLTPSAGHRARLRAVLTARTSFMDRAAIGLGNAGHWQLRCTADEMMRRAVKRAATMDSRKVEKTLRNNPGTRNIIIPFQGVTDSMVNIALTLEHLEQRIDDMEATGREGDECSRLIRRLQVLQHACL